MEGAALLPLVMVLCLYIFLPAIVFRFERGEKSSMPVGKYIGAFGIFTVAHVVEILVMFWIFMAFAYMSVFAGLGGAAKEAQAFLQGLGYVGLAINVGVVYIILVIVRNLLKLQFRNAWLPVVASLLLMGAEGGVMYVSGSMFQKKVLCGYIDKSARVVIEPKFASAQPFNGGIARVWPDEADLNRRTSFAIDKSGNKLGEDNYRAEVFSDIELSEGLQAKDGEVDGHTRWGYVDAAGKWQIKPQFSSASSFHEGLARVSLWKPQPTPWGTISAKENMKECFGFINHTGEFVVPPVFEAAGPFTEGMAWVSFDTKKWPKEIAKP